jgi:uncharacterized iron-regulated protein
LRTLFLVALVMLLAACKSQAAQSDQAGQAPIRAAAPASESIATRLEAVLPADIVLLGEQHDAPEHQQLAQQVVAELSSKGQLAALGLEMADQASSTAGLPLSASEAEVRAALRWNEEAWPWTAYGPAVMSAVRAGVPVLGANLPRTEMRARMADNTLDARLPAAALQSQQALIKRGHCDMLPASQIAPMTRIQIGKDIAMADTLVRAAQPGKVVVLMTGSVHADPTLGVPLHLPKRLRAKSVLLRAGGLDDGPNSASDFDQVWVTPPTPKKDYCAGLRESLQRGASGGS